MLLGERETFVSLHIRKSEEAHGALIMMQLAKKGGRESFAAYHQPL